MSEKKFIEKHEKIIKLLEIYCEKNCKNQPKISGFLRLNFKGKEIGECEFCLSEPCLNLLYEANEIFTTCAKENSQECEKDHFTNPKWREILEILPKTEQKTKIEKIKDFLNTEII